MEYAIGAVGRVVVLHLDDGDSIYDSIEKVAEREKIENGMVWIIGGVKNGGVVVGPGNDLALPPEPRVVRFEDPREILGVGMLFRNKCGTVKLHLHAAIGKGLNPIVGCPREGADCWLVNEIVIQEITGVEARRYRDEKSGFSLLRVGKPDNAQS